MGPRAVLSVFGSRTETLKRTETKMIPEIGLMVGVYIIARMLDMMVAMKARRGIELGRFGAWAVNGFGAVTVIVAVLVMVDLLQGSADTLRTVRALELPGF